MSIFTLPTLAYSSNALEPHISQETIEYHYGKHHKAYVDNLNKLIIGTDFESSTLEEIVKKSSGALFNNAAQFYNHNIYWACFCSKGGGRPSGQLIDKIDTQFGSFSAFKEEFDKACLSLFGSGWVWLALNKQSELEIIQTQNADTPFRIGKTPLLACDVWEHSYYIDRRNNRAAYIEAFWHIISWKYVEDQLKKTHSPNIKIKD